MTDDKYPACQGPDPAPTQAKFQIPPGAIDSHAHIFGTPDRYPFSPNRGYTPPEATLESYLELHKALGGINRAVLTQPSVYGTDNTCMLDAVDQMNGRILAIVAVDASVTDTELKAFHQRGARGVRSSRPTHGMRKSQLAGPLNGRRVIECSTVALGPWVAQTHGDPGADVIKIESETGDTARYLGPARNARMASFYLGCNRNKRSIVLDLKSDGAAMHSALWPRQTRSRYVGSLRTATLDLQPAKHSGD